MRYCFYPVSPRVMEPEDKLYLDDSHFAHLTRYDGWQSDKAFTNVHDPVPTAPQIETRLHEYALSKTLILVHRDPWNVVEDYYEPGKDFLSFDNVMGLKTLIPKILDDCDSYRRIVESAYEKVRNHSTEDLVRMVRSGNEFGKRNLKENA